MDKAIVRRRRSNTSRVSAYLVLKIAVICVSLAAALFCLFQGEMLWGFSIVAMLLSVIYRRRLRIQFSPKLFLDSSPLVSNSAKRSNSLTQNEIRDDIQTTNLFAVLFFFVSTGIFLFYLGVHWFLKGRGRHGN
jgi:hypothetical protein